ncbi:MAG: winged helix-turn-helix transcriptional regulator [Gaiellaceae bacterium]
MPRPAARARGHQAAGARYDAECPACVLLAHKWTPQIVAALLSGPHRFCALRAAVPRIGDKMLARRLAELEAEGIVERAQYSEIPPRVEYSLTPAGRALEPVIAAMAHWQPRAAALP